MGIVDVWNTAVSLYDSYTYITAQLAVLKPSVEQTDYNIDGSRLRYANCQYVRRTWKCR